jgi:hypothetical protein
VERKELKLPERESINMLNRKEHSTIFRLRTGHGGLRAHLHRIGLRESAACDCGADRETPEHILMVCPTYSEQRLGIWSDGSSLKNMLWGTGDDLKRTALFATQTGLRL